MWDGLEKREGEGLPCTITYSFFHTPLLEPRDVSGKGHVTLLTLFLLGHELLGIFRGKQIKQTQTPAVALISSFLTSSLL